MVSPITSITELAAAMGLSEFELSRLVIRTNDYYKSFWLSKKSGGRRKICAPVASLKVLQRWIADEILGKVEMSPCCTGFRKNHSILDNASPHCGKDFVFNTDIADFFGTVTFPRISGLFESLGYPTPVATVLARLTSHNGRLPQGAPSSPMIANLICRRLDSRLESYCEARGWSYTRYCDDITISGAGSWPTAHAVFEIIESEGFVVNEKKTRLLKKNNRQVVTGVVVNERPNVPRRERRRMRAIFHQLSTRGIEPRRHSPESVIGRLSFLEMINPEHPALKRYKMTASKLRARRWLWRKRARPSKARGLHLLRSDNF
jgi:RNA-directed DNA polymerase